MEKGYTPAQNAGDFAPPPAYPGLQQPVYTDYPPVTQPPTIITSPPVVGPEPCRLTCPSCHADIQTSLKHEPSTKTHLIALGLCCLCWPCVFVPYCNESCQNANHYCPNCNSYIGTYQH